MPNGTVLAIDDDPRNLQLLSSVLAEAGYSVRAANSGARALKMMEREAPDLVLLDITMPEIDGYEVCRRIRSNPALSSVPVLFLSALDDVESKVRGFAVGGVDYVTKPFEPVEVLARVAAQLGLVRMRRELERKNEELQVAAVQLERKNRILEGLSYLDALTGVSNRRHFDEMIDREWRRALRERHPLAVVMIDLDHFKALNDTDGHARGDECLREVAAALSAALRRPGDVVARYGGEEFVVVLPQCDGDRALQTAERLRAAVEARAFPHGGSPRGLVTASFGVASEVPSDGSSPGNLVSRADAALYSSKHEGRNRVTLDSSS